MCGKTPAKPGGCCGDKPDDSLTIPDIQDNCKCCVSEGKETKIQCKDVGLDTPQSESKQKNCACCTARHSDSGYISINEDKASQQCAPSSLHNNSTHESDGECGCCPSKIGKQPLDIDPEPDPTCNNKETGCCGAQKDEKEDSCGSFNRESGSCCSSDCCDKEEMEYESSGETFGSQQRVRRFKRYPSCCIPQKDGRLLCIKPCCSRASSNCTSMKPLLGQVGPSLDAAEKGGTVESFCSLYLLVKGIDCPSCTARIERSLSMYKSNITDVRVNVVDGTVSLLFNESLLTPQQVQTTIARKTGFGVSIISSGITNTRSIILRNLSQTQTQDIDKEKFMTIYGFEHVEMLKKGRIKVTYDPTRIHIRKVLGQLERTKNIIFDLEANSASSDSKSSNALYYLIFKTILSIILAIPVLVLSWAPIPSNKTTYGAMNLVLTTIIQWYCAIHIHKSALNALLKQFQVDLDLLVFLSTSTAWCYSVVLYGLQEADIYNKEPVFETSALLVTLILIGRLMSAVSRKQVTSAIGTLRRLVPASTIIVSDNGQVVEKDTPIPLVNVGDRIRIQPSEYIPLDGLVCKDSQGEIDESNMTGESRPVFKKPGDKVSEGTINLDNVIDITVTSTTEQSTISRIDFLIREAQNCKVPVQDFADMLASYIVPMALIAAAIVLVVWWIIGVHVKNLGVGSAFAEAVTYSISILVVSCPCPLALAVPMVFVISVTISARHGLFIKDSSILQTAKDVDTILFDKTGTLTLGQLSISESKFVHQSNFQNIHQIIYQLTQYNKHPVSLAVKEYLFNLGHNDASSTKIADINSVPGCGIQGRLDSEDGDQIEIKGGNPEWLGVQDDEIVTKMRSNNGGTSTLFCCTFNGILVAAFTLADKVRPSIKEEVKQLQKLGYKIGILSGDHHVVVEKLADLLEIQTSNEDKLVKGNCTVEQKAQIIEDMQTKGHNVLFCGDGTNDAVAMARANVSIAIGSGTDVAMNASQATFNNSSNSSAGHGALLLFKLCKHALWRVKLNLIWCFIYNIVAILFASGAFVNVRLEPQYAGLGELVSVMPVIGVAFTLYALRLN